MKMAVPEMLLETLEDLRNEDFDKFKWFLTIKNLDNCKPIAMSQVEDKTRSYIVTKMMDSYTEETSVNLAVEILKKMKMNGAVQRLRTRFSATPPPPSSSSASLPPPAAAMISAQQGSVVISPNIRGSTTGTLNITINKA